MGSKNMLPCDVACGIPRAGVASVPELRPWAAQQPLACSAGPPGSTNDMHLLVQSVLRIKLSDD